MSLPPGVADLIRGAPVSAHVATAVDGRPHVAPVWYLYDDGVVSFVTGGRKLANIRQNSRVAISIERADDKTVDWAVTLLGTATVFDDDEHVEWFDEQAFEKYWTPENPDEPTGDERYVEVRVASGSHVTY